jgi:hypothetical protein
MAITDYTSLRSAVQTYVARTDSVFSNMIPVFIELAEARIYNGAGDPGDDLYSAPLRALVMETSGTITMTSGVGTMPSTALEFRKVYATDELLGITYQTPERFLQLDENASGGNPVYYTVEDGSIKVTPAYTGTLTVTYFQQFDAINSTTTTNGLITAHGVVYLEAVLFEAFSFLQEIPLAAGHLGKYRSLVAGLNRTAGAMRYPGPMRVRSRMAFP